MNMTTINRPTLLEGSTDVLADTFKDVRWFAFFDHAKAWNVRWHAELLTLAFACFLEGKCPWKLAPVDMSDDASQNDIFSLRVAAWNVMFSVILIVGP